MMDKITERSAIVGWLKPLSRNAGTYDTDVVDMKLIKRAVVEVLCGAITTTGTLDVTLYGNTSSSTSGGTAITGKSTTDSTFNGSANSDGIARIEVEAAEAIVSTDNGWLRLTWMKSRAREIGRAHV